MENNTEPTTAPAPASAAHIGGHSFAKDFFLWLGFIIAFYSSIASILTLLFQYIDQTFPDAINRFGNGYSYEDPYSGIIRFAIATLIVFAPVAAVIMRIIRHDLSQYPDKARSGVRRFAIIATIFISSLTALIDVISLIYGFLDGSLTAQTELKIAVILLISVGVFLHFVADYRGYWVANRHKANMVGIGAVALCLAIIGAGFIIIGSPQEARLMRFDMQKVTDLQGIANEASQYATRHGELPVRLTNITDLADGYTIPLDPQSKVAYEYKSLSSTTFQLCAIFNRAATIPSYAMPTNDSGTATIGQHGVGHQCFPQFVSTALNGRINLSPVPTKPVMQ